MKIEEKKDDKKTGKLSYPGERFWCLGKQVSVEIGVFSLAEQDVEGKERDSAYIEFMKHRKMGN